MQGSLVGAQEPFCLFISRTTVDNTAIKKQYSSITVEFPIDDEFVELDTQIMFEMVRQLVAKGVGCDPEKVWIKSVSHITQLDQAPSSPGIS